MLLGDISPPLNPFGSSCGHQLDVPSSAGSFPTVSGCGHQLDVPSLPALAGALLPSQLFSAPSPCLRFSLANPGSDSSTLAVERAGEHFAAATCQYILDHIHLNRLLFQSLSGKKWEISETATPSHTGDRRERIWCGGCAGSCVHICFLTYTLI